MKPFKSVKPFQVRWKEPLGKIECPYAYRYVFLFFGFGLRVHVWLRSDDKRYKHSHPWWFCTLVVKGSYKDVYDSEGQEKSDKLNRFSFRFRKSNHKHYVDIPEGGCVTILLTGRPKQKWGFWIDGKMKRPLKYFYKFGHPICSEQ